MPEVHVYHDLVVTSRELHRIREWFDCTQDFNPLYLEREDYALAKQIYEKCGMRVPDSIIERMKG